MSKQVCRPQQGKCCIFCWQLRLPMQKKSSYHSPLRLHRWETFMVLIIQSASYIKSQILLFPFEFAVRKQVLSARLLQYYHTAVSRQTLLEKACQQQTANVVEQMTHNSTMYTSPMGTPQYCNICSFHLILGQRTSNGNMGDSPPGTIFDL